MMEKSNSFGVREVGKVSYISFGVQVYGVVAKNLRAYQIPFLYLGGMHLDYLSKPSLQLGDIMSLSCGLYMWAEIMCTILRLSHISTLHNPLQSLRLYFLPVWRGLWRLREGQRQRIERVWVSEWLVCRASTPPLTSTGLWHEWEPKCHGASPLSFGECLLQEFSYSD